MLVRALLFGTLVLAFAGCAGGGSSSGTEATPTSTATAPIETVAAGETEPALSAEGCTALGAVLSDIEFDTHPDWNFAFDFFPNDYERDRDMLAGLSDSSSTGDELDQLGGFLDAYASAAQEASVETGTIPATQDLGSTVWQSVNATGVDSIEVRIAIRALTRWVAGGCSAGGPPSGAIEPPPSATTTTAETTTEVAPSLEEPYQSTDCRGIQDALVAFGNVDYGEGSDFLQARDFLDDYADRAPDEIRDYARMFRDFFDRYASVAEEAGVEPGKDPLPDQLDETIAAMHLSSGDQAALSRAHDTLDTWSGNEC